MSGAVFVETLRRHLTAVGYLLGLFFVALAGILAASFNKPGSLWPSLVTLIAIVTGSGLIGPEFSTGALQLIISKPIRRSIYLISRVAGVWACVTIAALVGLSAEITARFLMAAHPIPWQVLGGTFGSVVAASLLAIALLTLLGSLTRAYFNAAIYLGAEVAFSVTESMLGVIRVRSEFLQRHLGIEIGLTAIDDWLFPSALPDVSGAWYARVFLTAIVAIAAACLAFERREVPYGAD